jgi:adenine-specific DNA glycosylase
MVKLMVGGLGYYRRARSLLEGAKTVMGDEKYKGKSNPFSSWQKGRLPHEPAVLEKEISGVGKYTAGELIYYWCHSGSWHQAQYVPWPTAFERQSSMETFIGSLPVY